MSTTSASKGPSEGTALPAAPPLATPEAYTIPIASRAPTSNLLQSILFVLFFNFCILSDNLLQLLVLPLSLHPATRPYFDSIIRYTKVAFGRSLLAISQFFGPTRLVLSFGDGQSGYLDPETFVTRNPINGKVERVDLPRRSVWMSNHQVYTDWLYLWCLAYYSDQADAILIILKKSLKWIPFVGWGMQFYRFIFLARNWAADQGPLARQLQAVASHSNVKEEELKKKLLLLIFPEGTLVSPNTRPLSKKYADKMGYDDLENLLLPRSTGLFFCLRTLGKEMDDLWLVDFTVGYPGIPPAGYGQRYYTLRSVFMQGVPPPAVHLHLTLTRLTAPAGSSLNPPAVSDVATASYDAPPLGNLSAPDASESEKKVFEEWLRNRWIRKDQLMREFYTHGDFVRGEFAKVAKAKGIETQRNDKFVAVAAEVRQLTEIADASCWGLGVFGAWYVFKTLQWIRSVLG
ncbi:hypothetical protein ACQY0O_001835 [Thecaphora frezii]